MSGRPEFQAPPEIYYDKDEATKYNRNTHIRKIQAEMTERALEMLLLPQDENCFILDIGCGSGIGGEILDYYGHYWLGIDISLPMLECCLEDSPSDPPELLLCDCSSFLARDELFDGIISISVLQWLCVASKKDSNQYLKMVQFFRQIRKMLCVGARAVFQFFPINASQLQIVMDAVNKASFQGGLVVDFPNSVRRKRYYLCVWAGVTGISHSLPQSLEEEETEESVGVVGAKEWKRRRKGKGQSATLRDRIIKKKEQQRRKGLSTRPDTKYTGRRRPISF